MTFISFPPNLIHHLTNVLPILFRQALQFLMELGIEINR
jgi:hypothetical protein